MHAELIMIDIGVATYLSDHELLLYSSYSYLSDYGFLHALLLL